MLAAGKLLVALDFVPSSDNTLRPKLTEALGTPPPPPSSSLQQKKKNEGCSWIRAKWRQRQYSQSSSWFGSIPTSLFAIKLKDNWSDKFLVKSAVQCTFSSYLLLASQYLHKMQTVWCKISIATRGNSSFWARHIWRDGVANVMSMDSMSLGSTRSGKWSTRCACTKAPTIFNR